MDFTAPMTDISVPAIEAVELTKNFINASADRAVTKALDSVTLSVPQGSICGLLGPNGAGKTTLLRIVNNILTSDSGSVRILGLPVDMDSTSPLVGYMPEERGLYDNMRIEDQIMYFGQLKGGKPARLRSVMDEYLELFNLSADRRRKIKELSKGNQQKVQIISTLVHEPRVVMLDEPFSGFDPINGSLLNELIDRLHQRGNTIILSSHNMEAIERMCDRIALINHGRIMLDGELSQIREDHRDGSLLISTRSELHIPLLMDSGVASQIIKAPDSRRRGHTYRVTLAAGNRNADLLTAVSRQGDIIHFEEYLPSLSDIFISYAKD